jgi:hypothetical protein
MFEAQSSVGLVTSLRAGVQFWQDQEISSSSKVFKTAFGLTQPLVQGVQLTTRPHIIPKLGMRGSIPPSPCIHGVVLIYVRKFYLCV